MRIRSAAAVVACLILAACTSSAPSPKRAPPSPSASGIPLVKLSGRIVFTRAGGQYGDETLFIINGDGTGEKQLSPLDGMCCLRAAPSGRQILYAAAGPGGRVTTAIMSMTNSLVRKLPLPKGTLNLGPGAFSPDGIHVALQGWDDKHPAVDGVYLEPLSGASRVRLTRAPAGSADSPGDFSPDGRQLVVFREGSTQGVGQLLILPVDGSGPPRTISPAGFKVGFGSVRFTPDGSRVLFQDSRVSSRGDLWTVKTDGTDLHLVFERAGMFASHPTYSPDGRQILFALNPVADDFQHRPNTLCVINADGSNLRRVLISDDYKREPEWLPTTS